MARDVEHFFMYLLAICTSSFENCLQFMFPYIHWVVDDFGSSAFFSAPEGHLKLGNIQKN
jgi:hypothetical protein